MRETRLYGLFTKQNGKWVRLYPLLAYRKSLAVRLFQDALLAGMGELRPIPKTAN